MKKLTLQYIADSAGVSCATVSRCLTGRDGVGEKTRQRVLRICREMGYNPNFLETASHRSGRIGLLCPTLENPDHARLASALERYLSTLGYGLAVAQSHGNRQQEQDALQRLLTQRVDGVIVIPTSRDSRKLLASQEEQVCGVFLGAHLGDQPESYVAVDHFLGGLAAVQYLHSKGHKHILFVGREESEVACKRRSGAVSAFRQLKLDGTCLDIKALHTAQWDRYTAVIAADCAIALALPQDICRVSFDGEALALGGIPLTTFDTPDSMASIAADILLEKLDRPVGGYSHRMVVPQLRERKQTTQEVTYG